MLLDYDGTLVSFTDRPQDAAPDKLLFEILDQLQAYEKLTLVL